jgi:hypothetical protein
MTNMKISAALSEKESKHFVFSKQTFFAKIIHLLKLFYYKKILGFNDVCTQLLNTATLLAIIQKHLSLERLKAIRNFNVNAYGSSLPYINNSKN